MFVDLSCRAYNILRDNAATLINLFRLMIPAGIPELTCVEDINYLRDMLKLDLDDKKAAKDMAHVIKICLNDTYRRIDNLIHNWKVS